MRNPYGGPGERALAAVWAEGADAAGKAGAPKLRELRKRLRDLLAERTPKRAHTMVLDDDPRVAGRQPPVRSLAAAMEAPEAEFVSEVQRLSIIGYGRMIQLIYCEWEKLIPGASARGDIVAAAKFERSRVLRKVKKVAGQRVLNRVKKLLALDDAG